MIEENKAPVANSRAIWLQICFEIEELYNILYIYIYIILYCMFAIVWILDSWLPTNYIKWLYYNIFNGILYKTARLDKNLSVKSRT